LATYLAASPEVVHYPSGSGSEQTFRLHRERYLKSRAKMRLVLGHCVHLHPRDNPVALQLDRTRVGRGQALCNVEAILVALAGAGKIALLHRHATDLAPADAHVPLQDRIASS
jgi:hypothetical protein